MTESIQLDLVKLENVKAVDVFTREGIDPVLDAITKEVKAFVPDMTTAKGRKEIASMAMKVAKSKTYLDDLGKQLTEEWKTKSKAVDECRKKLRDYLDKLKEEVRAPLTEWEERDEKRIKGHKLAIEAMAILAIPNTSIEVMRENLAKLQAIEIDESWDEFKGSAEFEKTRAIEALSVNLEKAEHIAKEQAELKRLREEAAEREKKDREERIAREAAERARIEAEAKAEREKKEALKLAQAEQERAEREKKEIEERAKAAERRIKEAEQLAKETAERAEKEKIEAAKRATEAERQRAQAEQEAKERETAKREANIKHLKKINNEALDALVAKAGLDADTAKKVIEVIAKGEIPNVRISY